MKQLQNLQEVAGKFQNQLQRIFDTDASNQDYLTERITAATQFFYEKTRQLTDTILQSPAQTDSRDNGREYSDQLTDLFAILAQKTSILKGLKGDFDVESYFVLKNTFILPDIKINAYAKTGDRKQASSVHPQLYYQLLTLRNKICEPNDLPIYLVAGSKTLLEMADYLPLTEKDLLRINGFGTAKVEKYGTQFLEIIQKYCADNHLKSNMEDKLETIKKGKSEKKETTEKKEKKEKGDSHRQSFLMFQEGKSIDEIATERGLTAGTVCGHLSKFIGLGQLSIDQFISVDKRQKALQLLKNKKEDMSVYQVLIDVLNPHEINFFLSWMRMQQ